MKRLLFSSLVICALLATYFWGTRLVEQTLDAKLADILSHELGITVSLAPVQVRIGDLTVHSPKMVLGDPDHPALIVEELTVSLDWSDVLRRELRLVSASATDLMINPSLWPGNDAPWPDDYRFLEPYLPSGIELAAGRYVSSEGAVYPLTKLQWRRTASGIAISARDELNGRPLALTAELASLDKLLRLASVQLALSATAGGRQESRIALELDLQPADTTGYTLATKVSAAGMQADISTGNASPWQLPRESNIVVDQLDLTALRSLLADYRSGGADTDTALATALPLLSLPEQEGHVRIGELRWQDELTRDTTFDFSTGPAGIKLTALTSNGPAGALQGATTVISASDGWQLELAADISAKEPDQGLAAAYLDADWLWHSGSARLKGKGRTWEELLYSLEGDVALKGTHRGTVQTPVVMVAKLDNRAAEFALDNIDIQFGEGRITGSAALSGDTRHKLSARLQARQLQLDALLQAEQTPGLPGLPVPDYPELLPGVELDLAVEIKVLQASDVRIDEAKLMIARSGGQAVITAQAIGNTGGKLDLRLATNVQAEEFGKLELTIDFASFDLPRLFLQKPGLVDNRSSGSISFNGQGKGLQQVFASLRGKADLTVDFRPDGDWQRPGTATEQLRIAGVAALSIKDSRIKGLQISELAVGSIQQDLTGTLSMEAGRKPWLVADLESDKLDITSLLKLRVQTPASVSSSNPLESLKNVGAARVKLKVKSLLLDGLPPASGIFQVSSAPGDIKLEQLDITTGNGHLASSGAIRWQKDTATLSLDATVSDLALDKLLIDAPDEHSVPWSGSLTLQSSGRNPSELIAGLTGDIDIEADPVPGGDAIADRRHVAMKARPTDDGMYADISHFQWGETDLAGSVLYKATTPAQVEITLDGGSLSLLAWESRQDDPKAKVEEKAKGSALGRTARAGANLVGDVMRATLPLIAGPTEAAPGEKIFSSAPLPLDWLHKYQVTVKGKLGTLASSEITLHDIALNAALANSQLHAEASAGQVNGGSGDLRVSLNAAVQPMTVGLNGSFLNLHQDQTDARVARSGYFDVTSQGQSQAELAGNINGLIYLELGQGPLDFERLTLLTADVATNAFRILIPGIEKQKPQLECGVTLAVFKDGQGITPYGYAARTDLANLVGRISVDLKKELLHISFSSSSRKGVGFSVGNVFSNTVKIEGPLSDPKILPNATGLLWRGWAAMLTGGLSVVGESALKRALASENPCTSVSKHIRKDVCSGTQPAAKSPLVCPK